MDPYAWADNIIKQNQSYDPMAEQRIKYMYELASANPKNSQLAMAYNQAYMDYMFPQQDPLMAMLGGGGNNPMTPRQASMESVLGNTNGSYTQDQLNQYRRMFDLGNEWNPEGISIEVPDEQGQDGGVNWARTLLTPLAEPVALGSSILGSKAGGASWKDAIDYGVSDSVKSFQEQNLLGQLQRGLLGEEKAKRAYQVPISQQWNQLF